MREIKFRAWDTERKKMEYCGLARIGEYHELMEHPLMQFTGLKDKNSKEIYEGDIVKHQIYSKFAVKDLEYFFSIILPDVWKWGWYGNADNLGFEVIGNLYENPELIEK